MRRQPYGSRALTALFAASVLLASACTTSEAPPSWLDTAATDPARTDSTVVGPSSDADVPPIEWGGCEDDIDPEFDCGTVTVPLDHDNPGGDTIDIVLVRLSASGPRQGAILLNPGGPGGSGIDFATSVAFGAVAGMGLDSFDLIGFDPRGVDRSAGIRCLTDEELDRQVYLDIEADDPDAVDQYDELDTLFADGCSERYGDTLRHFSTEATARDMDLIRAALGDQKISYIGISYGTYLGAVYTSLFPDRVEAFVLDSGFEPTGDSVEEQYLTQIVGFEDAFGAWADACASDDLCPLPADGVGEAWDEVLAELRANPVAGADGRVANGAVFETATVAALYDPLSWSILSNAIEQVRAGDPSLLFLLADSYVGRRPDGTFSTLTQSNTVISCASGFARDLPDDPEAMAELIQESAPRFGADASAEGFGDDCIDLMPPVDLPQLSNTGDGRFVVIGGLNDPATPLRWSEKLADALGPNAVLVTWDGEGHGQLFESSCLMEVAGALLVDGELPDAGVVCDPDPPIGRPDWWGDIPVPAGVSEPLAPTVLPLLGLTPTMAYAEVRSASGSMDAVLDLYEAALRDRSSFMFLGREETEEWFTLSTFLAPGGNAFVVGVLDGSAADDPDLALLFQALGVTNSIVVLAYIPF